MKHTCGMEEASEKPSDVRSLFLEDIAELPTLARHAADFTKLTELEIQGGSLAALPRGLGRLKKLKVLRLDVGLERLPSWLGELVTLEELSALQNRLSRLPASVGQLSTSGPIGAHFTIESNQGGRG